MTAASTEIYGRCSQPRKSGPLWNYRPLCTGHLSIFSKWNCKLLKKRLSGQRGRTFSGQKLLNSEGQGPEALQRWGGMFFGLSWTHKSPPRRYTKGQLYGVFSSENHLPGLVNHPQLCELQICLGWVVCQCTPASGKRNYIGCSCDPWYWCVLSCYLHQGSRVEHSYLLCLRSFKAGTQSWDFPFTALWPSNPLQSRMRTGLSLWFWRPWHWFYVLLTFLTS